MKALKFQLRTRQCGVSWNVPEPGWMESDTVSYSGPSASGTFAYTFNQVDLFSAWVESVAMLGKRAEKVVAAAKEMRLAMPFEQKGIDTDNGEEFINWELDRYCHNTGLKRFRSRPNKKDDQAHIEQKNGTHVRRLIGWDRYDTDEAVAAMNDLYRNEWRFLTNLFLPSVKLAKKIRIGSRTKRVYGTPKTPLDRLRDSGKGGIPCQAGAREGPGQTLADAGREQLSAALCPLPEP